MPVAPSALPARRRLFAAAVFVANSLIFVSLMDAGVVQADVLPDPPAQSAPPAPPVQPAPPVTPAPIAELQDATPPAPPKPADVVEDVLPVEEYGGY